MDVFSSTKAQWANGQYAGLGIEQPRFKQQLAWGHCVVFLGKRAQNTYLNSNSHGASLHPTDLSVQDKP